MKLPRYSEHWDCLQKVRRDTKPNLQDRKIDMAYFVVDCLGPANITRSNNEY